MARYIDADALYEKLYLLDLVDKRLYTINAKAVADAIANIPTADVVPTSMVDETTKQFLSLHDKYQEQQVEIEALRGAANSYKMHYENLAREIFSEIEKVVNRYCKDYKYSIADVLLDIAELKNKYTEGIDEKGSN